MPIGGLDIGSTGSKITVCRENGEVLYTDYRAYPVDHSGCQHEIHARVIWRAVRELLAGAAENAPGLSAVGITSFGESFVLLDQNDEELYPTMMYTDPRGEAEAASLSAALGNRVAEISGAAPHSMYSLPKLMWIKSHEPALYKKGHRVCLIADYLAYMLTGRHAIDYSLAARTMGLNIREKRWSEALFLAAGIDDRLFGDIVPSGTEMGKIKPELADQLQLSRNLRIVLCCHDQIAAAVGAGVLSPGTATDGAGTVQCMTPVFPSIPHGHAMQDNSYSVVPFLNDGAYCCYAFSFTGGSLVNWFVDTLAGEEKRRAAQNGRSIYDELEAGMTDAPTGILALPHFAGAATPYMDNGSKGAFLGLTLSTTTSDMYRAVLEGVALEMMLNKEKLMQSGIKIDGLNATGGGAKSALWLQMKADILNVPVTRMSVDEAGTLGGILLTGVATGAYASLEEAVGALVRPLKTYYPRDSMHALYAAQYDRYRRVYNAVRPLMEG